MTFIELIALVIKLAPYAVQVEGAVESLIRVIQAMRTLTPAQEQAAITVLQAHLAAEVAAVQAIPL